MLSTKFYMGIVGDRKTALCAHATDRVCGGAAHGSVSFVEWSLLVAGGRVEGDIGQLKHPWLASV